MGPRYTDPKKFLCPDIFEWLCREEEGERVGGREEGGREGEKAGGRGSREGRGGGRRGEEEEEGVCKHGALQSLSHYR